MKMRKGGVLVMVLAVAVVTLLFVALPASGEKAAKEMENPFGHNKAAVKQGADIFEEYCTDCHGDGTGGVGPSLVDDEWLYGDTDAKVFESVADGRGNTMPPWLGELDKEQIWKIVAFIRSIKD